ncbi:MAG: calcineurin, partial [Myxococcota bacterium]
LGSLRSPRILRSSESPVWSRHYSRDTTQDDCRVLAQVLASASVRRMVVAHTVQDQGINSECNGMVWRIDVGLADYYGGPSQVLEIDGNRTRIIAW